MKFLFINVFVYFIFFSSNGQEVSDQIKGDWVIRRFQAAGQFGMTYQIAELYIGDTITINRFISKSLEENKYTRAAGISPNKCKFQIIKEILIEDPIDYFSCKFEIKPILLGIKEPSQVYLISTNCNDVFFKEIHFDANNDKVLLYSEGMFFILDRLVKKSKSGTNN